MGWLVKVAGQTVQSRRAGLPAPALRGSGSCRGRGLGVGIADGSLCADPGSDSPATQLPLWMAQVLGEMVVQGLGGGGVLEEARGGGGGGAGTFLCTKAGRACELCRGGSRPVKLSVEKPVQPH